MEAKNLPIKKVFSSDFVLNIPIYQRPYAWDVDHAEALIDDLISFHESYSANTSQAQYQYFLGSAVLVKKEEPTSEVLDGQQRLTTLTILLSALRHNMQDGAAKRNITQFLYEEGNDLVGTQTRYRLSLRDQDRSFFNQYIQDLNGFERAISLSTRGLSDSQRHIIENAKLFNKRISELSQDAIKAFTTFVLTRCYLVVVWTPDTESAFRIFSVLNTRGLPLSPTDIVKAECIRGVDPAKRSAFGKTWEDLEDQLGQEAFGELFGHIRMIARRTKAKETLVQEFLNHIKPQANPIRFLDETLIPNVDVFESLLAGELPGFESDQLLRSTIKWLNQVDNRDWLPPALYWFQVNRNADKPAFANFFSRLLTLASNMMLRRVYENDRLVRYGKLLEAIAEHSENAPHSPLHLSEDEKRAALETLNSDVYRLNSRVRRFLILRLDESLSDGSASYDMERMTIEHVLPQNPDSKSNWIRLFSESDREIWTHKLANLVPLSKKKNTGASNLDFEEKKAKYFEKRKAAFVLTAQVLNEAEWTPTVLETRQKQLVRHLATTLGYL